MALTDKKTGETSHEGRVVDYVVDYGVRIMSDVWADIGYAVVYEPTREHTGLRSTGTDYDAGRNEDGTWATKPLGPCGYFRRVTLWNSEFPNKPGEGLSYEIDATEEAAAAYEGWQAGKVVSDGLQERERWERNHRERLRTVDKGKWVRVTAGRKVAHGTEGIVFWIQEQSYYGRRQYKIGIGVPRPDGTFRKTTRAKRNGDTYETYADVKWTYAHNVEVIDGFRGRTF